MTVDIARAWKDPEYRKSLTPEELATLPENPAGKPELTDKELDDVAGGDYVSAVSDCCVTPHCKPKEPKPRGGIADLPNNVL
jgi:mersacidin/lichenicidin family type 2 lantibiotic